MSSYQKKFGRVAPVLKLLQVWDGQKDVHSVFGIILFTEKHPYVIKVLRDDDLWQALNAVSGPRWPIFAIRPRASKPSKKIPHSHPDGSVIAFLQVIEEWHEPQENLKLLDALQINDTKELPLLAVFTELRSGDIGQLLWKFKPGKTKDECFEGLSTVLTMAHEAIENVTQPNLKNNNEVFNLIQNVYCQFQVIAGVKKAVSIAQWIKELAALFKG